MHGLELVDISCHSHASVNEADLVAHVEHELTMLHQVNSEVVVQDEEVLFEVVHGFHTVLVLYGLFPHAHELPLLELLEELVSLDVVVRITFDEPLSKREEFDGLLLLVHGDTFARKSEVLVLVGILVGCHSEVIGVVVLILVQIEENCLFVTLAVKK